MINIATKYKKQTTIGNTDSAILLFFFLYGLVSQYFLLSFLAGITLAVIVKSLWKPYLPPVLLFFISFHWVQIFSAILYADFSGQTLDILFNSNGTSFLFIMTFLQVIVMTLVLNRYVFRVQGSVINIEILKSAAEKLNTKNIIIGYFIVTITLPFLISFSMGSSSLYQLVLSFGIIKSLFTVLLFFIVLLKNTKNRTLIIAILIFDFILSFASYFSSFKLLIIMLLVAFFTVNPFLRRKTVIIMLPVLILLVTFLSFWSYVKQGYREYLNQGVRQQISNVSSSDALKYLYDEIGTFGGAAFKEGGEVLLSRIQYMERYSETYKRVPSVIEHKDGEELANTLSFLLVPRFLDANKGIKDASERTSYYTGTRFSKASQGTSISMGYFCDLYIDFGLYGMFIPLILIATLVGLLYKKILYNKRYNILFTYAVLIGTFLALGTFESDLLFFLGIVRNHIAFLILGYFLMFPVLHKFILNKK